jgi:hypothetical protein
VNLVFGLVIVDWEIHFSSEIHFEYQYLLLVGNNRSIAQNGNGQNLPLVWRVCIKQLYSQSDENCHLMGATQKERDKYVHDPIVVTHRQRSAN